VSRLDRIPELLVPLPVGSRALALTALNVAAGTVMFFAGEFLLSRVLFRWHVRDHRYEIERRDPRHGPNPSNCRGGDDGFRIAQPILPIRESGPCSGAP
jgi:hypothetical protein